MARALGGERPQANAWYVPIYDIERGFWHAGHPCGLRTVYTAGALGRCIRRAACWRGRIPLGQGRRATGKLPVSPALPLAWHWPVSPRRARRLRPQRTISSHCPALSPKPSTERNPSALRSAYRAPSTRRRGASCNGGTSSFSAQCTPMAISQRVRPHPARPGVPRVALAQRSTSASVQR